ncbi:MAG: caspase family protein [Planctomycetota bacterium]|jgi:hypothetical protein
MKRILIVTLLLAAAGVAQNAPTFTGKLHLAVKKTGGGFEPGGPAALVASSEAGVYARFTCRPPLKPGATLQLRAVTSTGAVAYRGQPMKMTADADTFTMGLPIAGQWWTGLDTEFQVRIHLDDGKEPVLSLPLKIDATKRHALIVSIRDYKSDSVGDLIFYKDKERKQPHPTDLDAKAMRTVLGMYGFRDKDIVAIHDHECTRERILKELESLAARAGPKDAVVFYYTGHGGQVPDLDGDEADHFDEALVPTDFDGKEIADPKRAAGLITDDVLAEIFAKIKTKNFTIIVDSCHSGTMVRDDDVGDKKRLNIKLRFKPGLEKKAKEAGKNAKRNAFTGRIDLNEDQPYVFLYAAQPHEVAVGNQRLVFSRALCEELMRSPDQSWAQIIHRVRPVVVRRSPTQTPGAVGATSRLPFQPEVSFESVPYTRPGWRVLGALRRDKFKETVANLRKKPPVFTESLNEGAVNTHIALVSGAGTLVKPLRGVIGQVYAPGAAKPHGRIMLDGRYLGTKKTWKVGFANHTLPGVPSAVGRILSGRVRYGDRVVPEFIPLPEGAPGLLMRALGASDPAQPFWGALRDNLASQPGVRLRKDPKDYSIRVHYLVKVPRPGTVQLIDLNGQPVMRTAGTDPAKAARELASAVAARHAAFGRLTALHNPSPSFGFDATLNDPNLRRAPGSTVKIKCQAASDAKFLIFAATDDGRVALLKETKMLKGGQAYAFECALPDAGRHRMLIKVIACTKPVNFGVSKFLQKDQVSLLFERMQKELGTGGNKAMLSTEGWADTDLRVRLRQR